MLFLQGILPLLAYVIAETFWGVRKAVLVALFLAVIEIVWSRISLGYFEQTGILSGALIGVMGGISYKMNSPLMIRLQPVVLSCVFAGVLTYYQFFDEPLIFKFYPLMKTMMPADQYAQLEVPEIRTMIGAMCGQLIGVFLVHGALVAVAAFRWNRWVWLAVRSIVIYAMVFAMVVINVWAKSRA